jgi:hypothetical protein
MIVRGDVLDGGLARGPRSRPPLPCGAALITGESLWNRGAGKVKTDFTVPPSRRRALPPPAAHRRGGRAAGWRAVRGGAGHRHAPRGLRVALVHALFIPCGDSSWNIQGGVTVTLTSTPRHALRGGGRAPRPGGADAAAVSAPPCCVGH